MDNVKFVNGQQAKQHLQTHRKSYIKPMQLYGITIRTTLLCSCWNKHWGGKLMKMWVP